MHDHQRWRDVKIKGLALARDAVPALITGGVGDDPSGVLTYTIVGPPRVCANCAGCGMPSITLN